MRLNFVHPLSCPNYEWGEAGGKDLGGKGGREGEREEGHIAFKVKFKVKTPEIQIGSSNWGSYTKNRNYRI